MASSKSETLRDALKTARGLGSSKHGTEHWWAQRLTAVALVPLCGWFVVGLIQHLGATRGEVAVWMGSPVVATLTILMIAAGFHHGQAGMQVVYEDYIHHEGLKIAAIIVTKFAAFALAVLSILAVVTLSVGA